MKFVTVKESHYQNDLVVIKSRLESEGIFCRFKNELTAQVLNHIPSLLVELQVPEEDVLRVKEILIEIGELQPENAISVCPKCGSENLKMKLSIVKRVQLLFLILYTLLLNVPIDRFFKKANYFCKDCGCEVEN